MTNDIHFQQLTKIEHISSDFCNYGNDFLFARITPGSRDIPILKSGFRYDGMMLVMLRNGAMKLNINLHNVEVSKDMVMAAHPKSVINIDYIDWQSIDAYLLVLSPDFMRTVSIDLNVVAASINPIRQDSERYLLPLEKNDVALLTRIFEAFHLNAANNTDSIYVKSIARSLITAIFYQLMQVANARDNRQPLQQQPTRKLNYVQDFMHLVHENYKSQRSIAFYADKLFISPKYLSMIIKEATGRSAAEWIDQYVIIEAKNLLKYSGMNVQQIAYELNFNNQSSFGKYFKHLTGMSPTKYQQSN